MTLSAEQEARSAAQRFREEHRLGAQPLGDLVALIEQTTGCDVAVLDAEADEHGLTMGDPVRERVFIGVARSRQPMRQRSTLAHELGHFVFGDWGEELVEAVDARPYQEIRADAFARHLLAPVPGVTEFLGVSDRATEATLAEVVQRFLVSPAIAAIVLRDAGYITPGVARQWMNLRTPQLATRFGWRDYYESLQSDSDRLRAPQRLLTRTIAGYAEGVVKAQTIATLRGVPAEAVVAELYEAGITPMTYDPTSFELEELPTVEVDLSGLEGEASSR